MSFTFSGRMPAGMPVMEGKCALFKEFAAKATKNLTVNEHYDIALSFLKQCGEAGLFYE